MEIWSFRGITDFYVPVDDNFPAGQAGKPKNHLYRSRLAGSVWAEKSQQLTLFHAEGKAVDSLNFAIHFNQSTAFQYFQSFTSTLRS